MKDYRKQFRNWQQYHEASIANWIKRPCDAMYDIGVGPKTEAKTLKKIYPDMQIWGCEPQRDLDIDLTPFRAVWPLAIGKGVDTRMYIDPKDPLQASMYCHGEGMLEMMTPTVTLDTFDQAAGSPWSILLWIDIEGYEIEAMETGPEVMTSGRINWINIEERLDRPCGIRKYLESLGYIRCASYNRHETHQDVIYKRRNVPSLRRPLSR